MKFCLSCKEDKSLTEFNKNKSSKDGLGFYCKFCSRKNNSKWNKENPNSLKQSRLNSYQKHKEKRIKERAEYYQNNKQKVLNINNSWRNSNPEKIKKYSKNYCQKNKNIIKIKKAKYYKEHINEILNTHVSYYMKNKSKFYAKKAKRRAAKLKATPKWLTQEQLHEIEQWYIICKEIQWLSEEPLEVDHIIPLQGKNVCGFHHPDNLQIISKSENCRKSNIYELQELKI